MYRMFKKDEALSTIENYFTALTETGHVTEGVSRKLLLYMFLLDFMDTLFVYCTEADYDKINRVLSCIFNGRNCLLPYKLFYRYRTTTKIGLPVYMSTVKFRATEVDEETRTTENEQVRTA